MLKRFGMLESYPDSIPGTEVLSKGDCPATDEEKEAMSHAPYRECVGALQYLSVLSRPDITFAVSQASRFQTQQPWGETLEGGEEDLEIPERHKRHGNHLQQT